MHRFLPGLIIETGPMYSEKTLALIRHLERYRHALDHVQAFYSSKDTRTIAGSIRTRLLNTSVPARPLATITELLTHLDAATHVIGIDEAQFFSDVDAVVSTVVHDLIRKRGLRVIIAGLNLDYAGRPFPVMNALMPYAEKVNVNPAVCTVPNDTGKCGHPAGYSQLFLDSELTGAMQTHEIIQQSSKQDYQPRCALHYTFG